MMAGWPIKLSTPPKLSASANNLVAPTTFFARSSDPSSIADDNWHHVVLTCDRSGSAISYFDGVAVREQEISAVRNLDSGHPTSIGQDSTGAYGVIARRNAVLVLMSIELMLNAVNINLVAFSAFGRNVAGQVFALFVITIAAAEVGVGLAIVLLIYRNVHSADLDEVDQLKG